MAVCVFFGDCRKSCHQPHLPTISLSVTSNSAYCCFNSCKSGHTILPILQPRTKCSYWARCVNLVYHLPRLTNKWQHRHYPLAARKFGLLAKTFNRTPKGLFGSPTLRQSKRPSRGAICPQADLSSSKGRMAHGFSNFRPCSDVLCTDVSAEFISL